VKIGILAYGSLIEDPGIEIEPLITEKISNVETPFPLEFARTSKTRDGAPTLVPVESGGSSVTGTILVLDGSVDLDGAKNILWRRERRIENSGKVYQEVVNPSPNKVIVEVLENFNHLDYVLYTKIGANIEGLTAERLADLAIESARMKAGEKVEDGISYLLSVKRQGIKTPLMEHYEQALLNKMAVKTLDEALERINTEKQKKLLQPR